MNETPACPTKPRRPPEHEAVVVAAQWVTPRIRRIVFGGDRLAGHFATPAGAHAPYLKLLLGPAEAPLRRTYSIRRLDAARDELHVDFVLHDASGPGSAFGRAAKPGDSARLCGPGHLAVAACRTHLLVADHCGVPGLAHLLEHLPPDATGRAIVEIPDEGEVQDLRVPAGVTLEWIVRAPGTPSRLASCCAAPLASALCDTLVWAGAEAEIARPVRSLARREWLIPPRHCQVLNYWKAGRAEGSFSFVS